MTPATIMATTLLPNPVHEITKAPSFLRVPPSICSVTRTQAAISVKKNLARSKFLRLARKWKKDSLGNGLVEYSILNPSYQKIIGMGAAALPFIFEDMKTSKAYWAHALESITDVDPTPENARRSEVRKAWLEWAERNGYGAT